MHPLKRLLQEKIVIFDGAMGTLIQQKTKPNDYNGYEKIGEVLVLTKPQLIKEIHEEYIKAGADIIETNSFSGAYHTLKEYKLEELTYKINYQAARIAKEVALSFSDRTILVAGSIGPGSKLPLFNQIEVCDLKDSFKLQLEGLIDGGIDIIIIETVQDILQAKVAIMACHEVLKSKRSYLPIIVSITIEPQGTTLTGTDILTAITVFAGIESVFAIGINCSQGPEELEPYVKNLSLYCPKPTLVMPNAGLPQLVEDGIIYTVNEEQFAIYIERFVKEYGIDMVGGCCGTTPKYIRRIKERLAGYTPKKKEIKGDIVRGYIASLYQNIPIKQSPPPLVIGERTNVTGSKKFRNLLTNNDFEGMTKFANNIDKGGVHLIDLSLIYPGRDEKEDLKVLLKKLRTSIRAGIMLDSTNPEVIKVFLEEYPGKGIINSVSLEKGEEYLCNQLKMIKEYGAGVVALTIDENGMAMDKKRKLEVAKRIYDIALDKIGFPPQDLLFDPLTFSIVSGDNSLIDAGKETLDAIELIKNELTGVNTILGISNISYGIKPNLRKILNSVFLYEAIKKGVDAVIINPEGILPLTEIDERIYELSLDLIYNRRKDALLNFLKLEDSFKESEPKKYLKLSPEMKLKEMIINGDETELKETINLLLKEHSAEEIISNIMLPAMEEVGNYFEKGKLQLPFVLRSAEVMKKGVEYLKGFIKDETRSLENKARIILATVKGDIHDVGKNLVKIILENNGYEVIDLGVKVEVEKIIDAIYKYSPTAVGLSALLVQSALQVKNDLKYMKARGINIPIILGGASIKKEFVMNELRAIYEGALFYAKDGFSGLKILDNISQGIRDKLDSYYNPQLYKTEVSPKRKIEKEIKRFSPPQPPFLGTKLITDIKTEELTKLINKNSLFNFHWKVDKHTGEKLYEQYLKVVIENTVPYGIIGLFMGKIEDQSIFVNNKITLNFPRDPKTGISVIDFLGDIGEIVPVILFSVTLGQKAMEIVDKAYWEDRYSDYFILHGFMAEMVEALAEYIHSYILSILNIMTKYKVRYSPGYPPAWPDIKENEKIISLLEAEKSEIKFISNSLYPRYSITAIINWNPEGFYY